MNFDELLRKATLAITHTYFDPPTLNRSASLRERVYCYELYHQLRSIWPQIGLTLHGEADKVGHPYALTMGKVKPDFIVHRTGSSGGDVIMEVKKSEGLIDEAIRADIEKLERFSPYYKQCIFLVFGEQCNKMSSERALEISSFACDRRFQLWHHAAPLESASLQMGEVGDHL